MISAYLLTASLLPFFCAAAAGPVINASNTVLQSKANFRARLQTFFQGIDDANFDDFARKYGQNLGPDMLFGDLDYIFVGASDTGPKCKSLGALLEHLPPAEVFKSKISLKCLHTATKGSITRENYPMVWTKIEGGFDATEFFAFDAEFTAAHYPGQPDYNKFDQAEERFKAMSENVNHLKMIQFGLALFTKDPRGQFDSTAWTFYMSASQADFDAAGQEAIKFHTENGLDFDKVINHGIKVDSTLPTTAESNLYTLIFELTEHLKRSRKPLVCYSGTMDLMFMLRHLFEIDPTALSYADFKTAIQEHIPNLIDAKYIQKDAVQVVDEALYPKCLEDDFWALPPYAKEIPDASTEALGVGAHDAGYDSIITGNLLLRQAQFLGCKLNIPISDVLGEMLTGTSPAAFAFVRNRVFFRDSFYPYMDLLNDDDPETAGVYALTRVGATSQTILDEVKIAITAAGLGPITKNDKGIHSVKGVMEFAIHPASDTVRMKVWSAPKCNNFASKCPSITKTLLMDSDINIDYYKAPVIAKVGGPLVNPALPAVVPKPVKVSGGSSSGGSSYPSSDDSDSDSDADAVDLDSRPSSKKEEKEPSSPAPVAAEKPAPVVEPSSSNVIAVCSLAMLALPLVLAF